MLNQLLLLFKSAIDRTLIISLSSVVRNFPYYNSSTLINWFSLVLITYGIDCFQINLRSKLSSLLKSLEAIKNFDIQNAI